MANDQSPVSTSSPEWGTALRHLAEAGDRLAQLMTERDEPLGAADAHVALLGALMDAYLNQVSGDPDFPSFVPCCGFFQHLGSPNPDTIYRRAPIDSSGVYKLTGTRGDALQVTIMPFSAPSAAGMAGFDPFDLSELTLGADGSFEVVISQTRPEGWMGDFWEMDPGMASLWLRTVSAAWGAEREPRVGIVRLDGPASRPRPEAQRIEDKIGLLGLIVEHTIGYGIRHADELFDEGVVNQLKLIDYGANGAMPLQSYHEGAFDLDEEHCLLLEATLPEGCDYFSFSLTDRMFVTLDWTHAQTSLNSAQAVPDDDGVLRVVVSGSDPGVANWMDTTGYQRGVLQCRWIGSEETPEVSASLVLLDELDGRLPESTRRLSPAERVAALQARSLGFQQRSLW